MRAVVEMDAHGFAGPRPSCSSLRRCSPSANRTDIRRLLAQGDLVGRRPAFLYDTAEVSEFYLVVGPWLAVPVVRSDRGQFKAVTCITALHTPLLRAATHTRSKLIEVDRGAADSYRTWMGRHGAKLRPVDACQARLGSLLAAAELKTVSATKTQIRFSDGWTAVIVDRPNVRRRPRVRPYKLIDQAAARGR